MEVKKAIIELLLNEEVSLHSNRISDYLELSLEETEKNLSDMVQESYLKVSKNGKYFLPKHQFVRGLKGKKNKRFLISLDDYDIYIEEENAKGDNEGDFIVIKVIDLKLKTNRIVNTNKTRENNNLATVISKNNTYYALLDDDKTKIIILNQKDESLFDGRKIEVKIKENIEGYFYRGDIIRVLDQHIDDFEMYSNIYQIASQYQISPEFPIEVKRELSNIPILVSEDEIKDRIDFRDEQVITIDGDGTKDFDDAVSVTKLENGNYLLMTHIADVEHYVKTGSWIFKEAVKRGFSFYAANKCIPMLPRELTNGICSLKEKVDRLTKSYIIEIDKNGEIVNYKIVKGVINSKKRMTYKKVEAILNGDFSDIEYRPFYNQINLCYELSSILNERRKRRGSINFERPEIEFVFDDKNNIIDVLRKDRLKSENIIEELMLVTNRTDAIDKKNKGLLCFYRVHGTPDYKKIIDFAKTIEREEGIALSLPTQITSSVINGWLEKLKETSNYELYSYNLLRCMKNAEYSIDNSCHFALSEDMTTHATSPIRRLPDLILQIISTNPNEYSENNKKMNQLCRNLAVHISNRERVIKDCERMTERFLSAEFMENKIGATYTGKITSISSDGMYVDIYNGIIGFIDIKSLDMGNYDKKSNLIYGSSGSYGTGDLILVTVRNVIKETGSIYLSLNKIISKENDIKVKTLGSLI